MPCCIPKKNEKVPYKATEGEKEEAPKPAGKTNKIKVEKPVEEVKGDGVADAKPTEGEPRRGSQGSVDVLAPVKEAQRKASARELTEEEKADQEQDQAVQAQLQALNEDAEAEKNYRKDSLVSHDDIGFVTISEERTVNEGTPSSSKGQIKAMPKPEDESETKKLDVEEPIIPDHKDDPNQILVGGAGGFD